MLVHMTYVTPNRSEVGAWKQRELSEFFARRAAALRMGTFIATSQVMKMKPLIPAAVASVVVEAVKYVSGDLQMIRETHCAFSILAKLLGEELGGVLDRDRQRYSSGHWDTVPWDDEDWFKDSPHYYMHSLHVPREVGNREAGLLAFAESPAKLVADRFTVMKAGRYLTRYFSDKLQEKEIKYWADKYTALYAPVTVLFARDDTDEVIRVIAEGPRESCMSNRYHSSERWFSGHIHPAAVYNTPDIEIGYIQVGDEITARVICNRNTKKMARAYGDGRRLLPAMEALGYQSESRALVGCRIRRIENDNDDGGYIMAYVDAGTSSGGGNLSYGPMPGNDEYWVLSVNGPYSTYDGYDNQGISQAASRPTCDDCDNACDEDDLIYVESRDRHVCDSCYQSDYVSAIGRRGWEDCHALEDCIDCESDGQWYVERYANDNGVYRCEVTNHWYKEEDMVCTSRGLVHAAQAVELAVEDSEGNSWAVEDDTATTHDGRVIHKDTAVIKTVYFHEDDDVDNEIAAAQQRAA